MNVDQIKESVSMMDVIEKYGIKVNRSGMCRCPFHGKDSHPSMKIYKDSFNCFACGASGDIFTFVQKMEYCDFKTAFYQLGGTYEKPSFSSDFAIYKAKKAKEMREKEEQKKAQNIQDHFWKIDIHRLAIEKNEPFSPPWVFHYNMLMNEYYWLEEQMEKR